MAVAAGVGVDHQVRQEVGVAQSVEMVVVILGGTEVSCWQRQLGGEWGWRAMVQNPAGLMAALRCSVATHEKSASGLGRHPRLGRHHRLVVEGQLWGVGVGWLGSMRQVLSLDGVVYPCWDVQGEVAFERLALEHWKIEWGGYLSPPLT